MRTPATLATLALLSLAGCGEPGAAPDLDMDGALDKRSKVAVCHVTSSGATREISVADSAVSAHVAHGDHLAGDWYPDQDEDGFGDADATATRCKVDSTDVEDNTDCNDDEDTAYPGNEEIGGDGIDNDCDGDIDEGSGTCPCGDAFDIERYLSDFDQNYFCAAGAAAGSATIWGIQGNRFPVGGQDFALFFAVETSSDRSCESAVGFLPMSGGVSYDERETETGLTEAEFDACLDVIDDYRSTYGCDFTL